MGQRGCFHQGWDLHRFPFLKAQRLQERAAEPSHRLGEAAKARPLPLGQVFGRWARENSRSCRWVVRPPWCWLALGWAGLVFCRNILLCVRGRDLFGTEGAGGLAVMRLAPIAVLQKHPSFLTVSVHTVLCVGEGVLEGRDLDFGRCCLSCFLFFLCCY